MADAKAGGLDCDDPRTNPPHCALFSDKASAKSSRPTQHEIIT